MSKVSDVLRAIEFQIRARSELEPIILDDIPSTPRLNEVYIIAPDTGGISISHMMSSDSWEDYDVQLYAIAHVVNMNRMIDVNEDINMALVEAEKKMKQIFGRGDRVLINGTITDVTYGTQTWVTDSKVFTACTVNLTITDFLEDKYL